MLLLIDNYDSFTYNLFHYLGELGTEAQVRRNDEIDVQAAMAMHPSAILGGRAEVRRPSTTGPGAGLSSGSGAAAASGESGAPGASSAPSSSAGGCNGG